MRGRLGFLIPLGLSVGLLLSACSSPEGSAGPSSTPAVSATSTGTQPAEVAGARATPPGPTPTLPLSGETTAAPPQVIVSDQFVRDNTIVVDQAIVPEQGWVAIHETLPDGAPGQVIGAAKVAPKLDIQVRVQLDKPIDGPTQLVAMLHRETSNPDSFDFPGADPPYTENGRPVVARFTARP